MTVRTHVLFVKLKSLSLSPVVGTGEEVFFGLGMPAGAVDHGDMTLATKQVDKIKG